jgi:hypothetical protein
MNTGRRRSAKGKWQDAMFPVKWPKYAGSTAGVTPTLPSGSPRREPKGIRVVFRHRGILSAYASGFR